jgi:hypothetical protein
VVTPACYAAVDSPSVRILATQDTLGEAGDIATSGGRSTPVKGVAAPVQVATIAWA